MQLSDILYHFPWKISFPVIQNYMINYYTERMNGTIGSKIKDKINKKLNSGLSKIQRFDHSYPFLFTGERTFTININGFEASLNIFFALGKRRNGLYHVLSPQVNHHINNIKELSTFISKYKITEISTIIDDFPNTMGNALFPDSSIKPNHIMSLASLFDQIYYVAIRELGRTLAESEIPKIEVVLSQASKNDALKSIRQFSSGTKGPEKVFFITFKFKLNYITWLYNYPLNIRPIIGSNTIIGILYLIIQLMLEERKFFNQEEAKRYIEIAANVLLENGGDMIPNWQILAKPIKAV